jgi:glyoxylase-like metal-dependent hydrolase (beta-lactamase superfamily II)
MLQKCGTRNAAADGAFDARFAQPPAPGTAREIAPGMLWGRLSLPFSLNHVNVYAIEDGDGWAIVDVGICSEDVASQWIELLNGPLAGRPVTKLIITHHHPDHMGMLGWFAERYDAPLYMSRAEFLTGHFFQHNPEASKGDDYREVYLSHGMPRELFDQVMTVGHNYQTMSSGIPSHYIRVSAGDVVSVGARRFMVLTGGGHSIEQVMLYCAEERIFIAADQLLPRISPNIGITAIEPTANPLRDYLESLTALERALPDKTLVLPGHDWPFRNPHARIDSISRHHRDRCDAIAAACSPRPLSAFDMIPAVFPRALDVHQVSFAHAETIAHAAYLSGLGVLEEGRDGNGIIRWRTVNAPSKRILEDSR